MGVVLNGRLGSLLAVKEMLIERIPVVVIANSGGVADFIRHGIELLKEHGARDETVTNSDVEHARVQVKITLAPEHRMMQMCITSHFTSSSRYMYIDYRHLQKLTYRAINWLSNDSQPPSGYNSVHPL